MRKYGSIIQTALIAMSREMCLWVFSVKVFCFVSPFSIPLTFYALFTDILVRSFIKSMKNVLLVHNLTVQYHLNTGLIISNH